LTEKTWKDPGLSKEQVGVDFEYRIVEYSKIIEFRIRKLLE
jgi:hypothetical protein